MGSPAGGSAILKPTLLAVPLVAIALAFAACGGDDDSSQPAEQAAPAAEAVQPDDASAAGNDQAAGGNGGEAGAASGTTISTGDSQFGEVLFDGDQGAIYYFDKEKTSESECYGDCAVAWPPVLTDGDPRSGGGAQKQLLGPPSAGTAARRSPTTAGRSITTWMILPVWSSVTTSPSSADSGSRSSRTAQRSPRRRSRPVRRGPQAGPVAASAW